MTIGNGGSFGELALLKEAPRFASVVCKKNWHFATLTKEDYVEILGPDDEERL
jgi:hypothetical protein